MNGTSNKLNIDSNLSNMHTNRTTFLNTMKTNSTLFFTIEQWELTRRLRNSGLTKEQICHAFDDIERVEKELGNIYNASNHMTANQKLNGTSSMHSLSNDTSSNSASTFDNDLNELNGATLSNTTANVIVNNHFASIIDPETENRELESLKVKGDVAIHNELSYFVYKNDLKQSQISRMAGVNQAYVSKFLRGEFFDLSENGKNLIYKWYLRFLKNPTIFLRAHNITLTSSASSLETKAKLLNSNPYQNGGNFTSIKNVTNTSYDTPKRTRFSFKPEHLVILEKSFLENQYPDQKSREDLARLCNEARPCQDRERVSEQIITHWFQNKRKITRKSNQEDETNGSTKKTSNTLKKMANTNQETSGDEEHQQALNYDFIIDYENLAAASVDEGDEYETGTSQDQSS